MDYAQLTEKKKRLDRLRLLPHELVNNLDEWFRIELTYTSNAIEGNTLTRQETALVVEKGITVGGKSLTEHLEATNHAHALDRVKQQIHRKPKNISEKDILTLHEIILKGIDDANAGRYRSVPIRISGSLVVLPNPRMVPELMTHFVRKFANAHSFHPVEWAAEAHYQLASIHPFVDGNGRTARLLMNLILLMYGYPAAIIRKQDRLDYIKSLEKAQLGKSKDDYMQIILDAVDRSLDIYLDALNKKPKDAPKDAQLLKIGALAKASGETTSTLRHWTKEGLLEAAGYTDTGYILYSQEMVERIRHIRALQQERLTLDEIKHQLLMED